jgi:hypothetical protein
MQRGHRKLLTIGVVIIFAGWLAWFVLLTESEQPAQVEQAG